VTLVTKAEETGVPIKIALNIIRHESNFDSNAINPSSNASGYFQCLPSTFKWLYDKLGLDGGKTAKNNIIIGLNRLKFSHDYWANKNVDSVKAWQLSVAGFAIGDSLPMATREVPDSVRTYVNYVVN
jgi:soluble lytic murein transglycosylase-like protein